MLHKMSSCSSPCCFLFLLLLLYFFTYNLSFFDVPALGFDERSARETFWSEEWPTTYRHKVHEYLNSVSIFRFYWTAQNTWPNPTIIHTWFRGLGPVSNVLKPLSGCVGVHGIRVKLALQTKHQGSKENTLIKKVALISFILPPAHFICAENWLRCRIATFLQRINPFYNYSTTLRDAYFQNFITSRVTPLTSIQPQSSLSQFQEFRYWTEGGAR